MSRGSESTLVGVSRVCGAAVLILGITVLCGWLTDQWALVQVAPNTAAMQCNTATCFAMCGGSLLALLAGHRRLALATASVVALLAGASLVEYALDLDLGIDQLLCKGTIMTAATHAGRMSPSTAFAMVVLVVALSSRRSALQGVFGCLVLALGGVAFAGHLGGSQELSGWGHGAQMAVHTSAGFVGLGLGVAAHALHVGRRRGQRVFDVPWTAWGCAMMAAAASVALWQRQSAMADAEILSQQRALTHALGSSAERFIGDQAHVIELLAARWELRRPEPAEWLVDAQSLLRENGILQAIEWVDPDYHIRWVAPENPQLVGFDLGALPERRAQLSLARAARQARLTGPVDLASGGKGFQSLTPLFRAGEFEGFFVAVSGLRRVLDLLASLPAEPIGLSLGHDGEPLVTHGETANADAWGANTAIRLGDLSLQLRTWPLHVRARVTTLLLVPGLLLSLGLGVILRSTQRARDRNRQLDAIIEAAPVGMLLVDEAGRIRRANPQARALFAGPGGHLQGAAIDDFVPTAVRGGHAALRAKYFQVPESRRMGLGRDLRARRFDGTEFPVEIGLGPVALEGQHGVLVTVVDISDRKAAELLLRERSEELARANEDLQQFAYVASHDLRAPLRAIQNLSKWLHEDLGDRIDAESSGHLLLMHQRVARMDALLDGLLQYSRIGRAEEQMEVVDLGALLRGIVEMLGPPPGFTVEFADPRLQIETSQAALQQVLLNLIANAIKHHDRPAGRVEVMFADAGDHIACTVTDDGPGIPADAYERVFEMFQTLRPRDEIEGTGMGLALVKKQVERFGGRVGIEPAAGRGSRFQFTWFKGAGTRTPQ